MGQMSIKNKQKIIFFYLVLISFKDIIDQFSLYSKRKVINIHKSHNFEKCGKTDK